MNDKHARARLLLIAALLVCAGGSAWAWKAGLGCPSCAQATQLVGTDQLPVVGVAGYGALLLLALFTGPSFLVTTGLLVAASLHVSLLAVLAANRLLCPPCLLTAAGAFFGAGVVLWHDPASIRRGVLVMCATMLAANAALFVIRRDVEGRILAVGRREAAAAIRERLEPPAGSASLVAMYDPACPLCAKLHREVLPALKREFGKKLETEVIEPNPEGPLPLVVVFGREQFLFPGEATQDLEELRRAVKRAMDGPGAAPAPSRGLPLHETPGADIPTYTITPEGLKPLEKKP